MKHKEDIQAIIVLLLLALMMFALSMVKSAHEKKVNEPVVTPTLIRSD